MSDVVRLPEGFVLDDEAKLDNRTTRLPPGFVIDESTDPSVIDEGMQLVRGFNRGLDAVLGLPGELMASGLELSGADEALGFDADRLRWRNNPISEFLRSEHAPPQTNVGRYLDAAGRAVGASALPTAAISANAARLAAAAPTTTLGRVARDVGQFYSRTPATAVGLDTASAATGGLAMQGAADAGFSAPGQFIAGTVGTLAPGAAFALRNPVAGRIGTETGASRARQRADEARADVDAFDRTGVRLYGPSFHQGPMASVGKQLSETPFVGSPLRQALDETFTEGSAAASRLANRISPNVTPDQAGRTLQGGIERFATANLADLEPGVVSGLGINPVNPIQPRQIMGRGQADRLRAADALRAEVGDPGPAPTRSAYLTRRTTAEDLTDNELQRVIRAPASNTSFAAKSEALYERARRLIPVRMRSDGSRNPNLMPATNTRQALSSIQNDIRNSFQGQRTINAGLSDRLANPTANFTIEDLFAIRTQVGRDLGALSQFSTGLDRQQLSTLYAALSQDIENALIDVANRTRIDLRDNRAGVTLADARRADQALRNFRIASRHHRAGMERIDSLTRILGADTPEAAVKRLLADSREGLKGSAIRFRRAMDALRPPERAEFAALLVREMGAPTPGSRGLSSDVGWSPNRFLTSYRGMSAENRRLLFTQDHREALDDLMRIAQRITLVEGQANTSRTATNTINVLGTVGALGSASMGDVFTPLTIGGSGYATSVMMSRPDYARWLVRYLELRAGLRGGSSRAATTLVNHITGLQRRAPLNPALYPVLLAVQNDLSEGGAR